MREQCTRELFLMHDPLLQTHLYNLTLRDRLDRIFAPLELGKHILEWINSDSLAFQAEVLFFLVFCCLF